MTSGLPRRRLERVAALLLAGLVLAGLPVAVHAADWDIAALMELLSRNPPGRATFNETRHLALLDRPLESSGELRFSPPRRLEKTTLAPGTETLVADGDVLTLERLGKRNTLSLRDHPEVAVFIDSVRGTLAGDRATLEKAFALSLDGETKRWTLVMRPLVPAVAKLVARIEVSGSYADIHRIEIHQPDGDYSLMTIERTVR